MAIYCYRTMELDTGETEVLRGEGERPRTYEVIARFYDKGDADRYASHMIVANLEEWSRQLPQVANGSNGSHHHSNGKDQPELSQNEGSVFRALLDNEANGIVKMNYRDLAEATGVSQNSISTALRGLFKKGKINTQCGGEYRIL